MRLLIGILGCLLIGCGYKAIPLVGTYSDGNYQATTHKSKEEVWNNIIELFATKGLPIKIIDKSSGLIMSGEVLLDFTYESDKGIPNRPGADVIIFKLYSPAHRDIRKPLRVTGEWNIRIKEVDKSSTLINVNLVNPKYTLYEDERSAAFQKGFIQSLGNFEKAIYNAIK